MARHSLNLLLTLLMVFSGLTVYVLAVAGRSMPPPMQLYLLLWSVIIFIVTAVTAIYSVWTMKP